MKRLGGLTKEEGKRALQLYEKKMAMENLLKILDAPEDRALYERAVKELKEADEQYDLWWKETYQKYQWKDIDDTGNQSAYIDFRENAVYLQ